MHLSACDKVRLLQDLTTEDKVRLLMIYAATHPEKLDATKRMQWMKVSAHALHSQCTPCTRVQAARSCIWWCSALTLDFAWLVWDDN